MRVLVAPDKFKGSLTAAEVAAHIVTGLRRVAGGRLATDCVPVADGGDGTLDAAFAAGFERVPVRASGPTGEPVEAAYARRREMAVAELASVCGLSLLPGGRPEPLLASSFGVGEVIGAAMDAGCARIVLGVGGSASTDGGAGMLQALVEHGDVGGARALLRPVDERRAVRPVERVVDVGGHDEPGAPDGRVQA